jgi:hypothetical protein
VLTRILVALLVGAFSIHDVSVAQPARVSSAFTIARLKYGGGGDWYNDPSAEVNLLTFLRQQTGLDIDPRYEFVEISDERFFTYPFVFMTGHGNVRLSENEVRRLRVYLDNGGFLYADDDYGMDKAFRREMKKVYPDQDHDKNPPQGLALFREGRLVVYYTYESNPSDGWADPEVHNDPDQKRQEALRFGANIVLWALTH